MYKDKAKQKEANRQAARRYRAKKKGMTQADKGMTPLIILNAKKKGMTPEELPRAKEQSVIPVQHDNPMNEPLR